MKSGTECRKLGVKKKNERKEESKMLPIEVISLLGFVYLFITVGIGRTLLEKSKSS